jgi:hypothetical protein
MLGGVSFGKVKWEDVLKKKEKKEDVKTSKK